MRTELRLATIVCVAGALLNGDYQIATAQQAAPTKGRILAEGCLVSLIDDRSVPAKEAGALVKSNVKVGDEVRAGGPALGGDAERVAVAAATPASPLAIVEYDIAAEQRNAAAAARDRALADAKNRISIEYAKSQRDVAKAQVDIYERANKRNERTIAELEMLKARLELRSAELSIEQAEHEFAKHATVAAEKEAELRVAERSFEHREIYSPIDGVVVDVYVDEGEWVRPGDPVFRVVNLKRLRVQASLDIAEWSPSDIAGRSVEVEVLMAGGKKQTFAGRIVFVNPEVKSGGRVSAWAEVENRKDARGHYQLLPGMKATMTVAAATTPK